MNFILTSLRNKSITGDLALVLVRYNALIVLVILIAGLLLRLLDLTRPFFGYHMWNEVYYTTIARNFDHFGLLSQFNFSISGGETGLLQRLGPAPLVPWAVYLSMHLFGAAEWAARLPMLILGMFSLISLYFISRLLFDQKTSLIALFLAAIMPGTVFLSRQVALDSPMAAFGLGSLWAALAAERKKQYGWLLVSALALGVSIFIKYTGVLFIPALGWIWYQILKKGSLSFGKAKWLMPLVYLGIAILPAAIWFVYGMITTTTQGTANPISSYLFRPEDMNPVFWRTALEAWWQRGWEQSGKMLWYPVILATILVISTGNAVKFARKYAFVILMILPWYAQLIYPNAWIRNDGYGYPALYGIALLAAIMIIKGLQEGSKIINLSKLAKITSIFLLGVALVVSSLWDYRLVYRSDYTFTWNEEITFQDPVLLINSKDPFAAAHQLRLINTNHLPVLADLPVTLYYSDDEPWKVESMWWWPIYPDVTQLMEEAIKSQHYEYVVFTYRIPSEVVQVLLENNYQQISPGLWEKTD